MISKYYFMGTQETIISIRVNKSRFWALFAIFQFLDPKKGRPQNPTKKLIHLVHLLGHLLSRNHVSNFSDLGPPPPPPPPPLKSKLITLRKITQFKLSGKY